MNNIPLQQSDTRQFISTAISIKNLIKNTFTRRGGMVLADNTTPRAFTQQDYTYDRPYITGDVEGLRNADQTGSVGQKNAPPDRKTYDVSKFADKLAQQYNSKTSQNIPSTADLKSQSQTSDISQFYWKKDGTITDPQRFDDKNLLSFTQEIVKNTPGLSQSIGEVIDQSSTTYGKNPKAIQGQKGVISNYTKGSAITDITNKTDVARAFTVEKPYSTIGDLIRNEEPFAVDSGKSVLDKDGFVRIAPKRGSETIDFKTLMFSIENLAWGGNKSTGAPQDNYTADLPCLEQGPNGGRVMWFPPYGITITDNSSVNWTSTSFVGRGEPIYTYNNAERTMTLQFKVIVDHPSILNAVKKQNNITIDQFFSATGSKLHDTIKNELGYEYKKMSPGHKDKLDVQIVSNDKIVHLGTVNTSFSIPNEVNINVIYSANSSSFIDNATTNPSNTFSVTTFIDKLYEVIDKVSIELTSSSSFSDSIPSHCTAPVDLFDVGPSRAGDFITYIRTVLTARANANNDAAKLTGIDEVFLGEYIVERNKTKTDHLDCNYNLWQSLKVKVTYNPDRDDALNAILKDIDPNVDTSSIHLGKRAIPLCESEYFEKMDKSTRFTFFNNLKTQLDYFHPSFHSMTPEGFNSRLTFLLQCTRQGPSIQQIKGAPTNMVFGRPPVCVLKIGDFYYTKVVIDSVNISYDDNLWDLNPEGIGVQPMIATVDLNMKVVGGSSLEGPITKLQNALSYHFFANTEVYMGDEFTTGEIQEPIIPPVPPPDPEPDPVKIEPDPDPVAPEVTYPSLSGITGLRWIMDGQVLGNAGITQDKDALTQWDHFKTNAYTTFSLDRAVTASDNGGKGYVEVQAQVIGAVSGWYSEVMKINAGDSHTNINIDINEVVLPMIIKAGNNLHAQPVSVRVFYKDNPGIFLNSDEIYIPAQGVFTGYDFGDGINSGPTSMGVAEVWTENPYCSQHQWLPQISPGAATYWCPCECKVDKQRCTTHGANGTFSAKRGNCYVPGTIND